MINQNKKQLELTYLERRKNYLMKCDRRNESGLIEVPLAYLDVVARPIDFLQVLAKPHGLAIVSPRLAREIAMTFGIEALMRYIESNLSDGSRQSAHDRRAERKE